MPCGLSAGGGSHDRPTQPFVFTPGERLSRMGRDRDVSDASGLVLDDVGYLYPRVGSRQLDRFALNNVQLSVAPGRSLALVGRSGSGKSTLLSLACGLLVPCSGGVTFQGRLVSAASPAKRRALRASTFGVIHQNFSLVEYLSVVENIELPGAMRGARRDVDPGLLDRFGLTMFADRRARDLSVGQRQRVAIARALHQGAEVIFADEPTAALDPITAAEAVSMIKDEFCSEGGVLLIATHDPRLAAACDEVALVADGTVREHVGKSSEAGVVELLRHPSGCS